MANETEERVGNELGEVDRCDCGGVNITMGPVTLHFAPEEMELLEDLVDAAMTLVGEPSEETHETRARRGRGKTAGHMH